MGEAALQKSIIGYARNRGAYVEKNHQGGYGRRGTSDLSICYRGHWMSVEVKAPGAKTSPARQQAQSARIHEVRRAGGIAFVTDNVDQVLDVFDQVDRLTRIPGRPGVSMGHRVIQPYCPHPTIVDVAA